MEAECEVLFKKDGITFKLYPERDYHLNRDTVSDSYNCKINLRDLRK